MAVTIRKANVSDVQALMDISKSVLRKVSFDETLTWMHVDPEGFVVAETSESQIIGTCCAIKLSPHEGFAGFYWVSESFRGRGIGRKLVKIMEDHLFDKNIAFRAGKESGDLFHSKYGFTYEGDNILIYEGHEYTPFPVRSSISGIYIATLIEGQLMNIQSSQDIIDGRNLTTEDIIQKVQIYDRSLRHVDLSIVVREMFFWRSCKASVAFSSGEVVGFGCLRPVTTGHWVVSPMYADSEAVAESIVFDLLDGFDFSQVPEGIWFRFPEKNTACIRLLEKLGFRKVPPFNFSTRFNKRLIKQDTSKIYSYYSVTFCTE